MKLNELDWKTSLKKIDLGKHWRILVGIVVCAVTATIIYHLLFPHVFWFLKLWAGGATGATLGAISGACWQLRCNERWAITSGVFIVTTVFGWGAMAAFTICFLVPDFTQQEKELADIRSLNAEDILFIHLRQGQHSKRIKNVKLIKALAKYAKKAELFYPGHEPSTYKFELSINRKDRSIVYDAYVPEYHQNDFAIQFYSYSSHGEIIIPGGRKWLETVLPQRVPALATD